MTLHPIRSETPDYAWCSYGKKGLQFRGPYCDFTRPYVAYLGGAETFGRFMDRPFPTMVSEETGLGCLNLSAINGGVEFCHHATDNFDMLNRAQAVVIEVMGAAHLSNAFFKVHPRRNDRVICTHRLLSDVFGDVDFVDVHFIRHLLGVLQTANPSEFMAVCQVLKTTWVARMASLLDAITAPIYLVWMADHDPGDTGTGAARSDPLLVDQTLVDAIAPKVDHIIQVCGQRRKTPDRHLRYGEFDQLAATKMLGQSVHCDVADQICEILHHQMKKARHG